MELGNLYQIVMVLVLVGMLLGTGLLVMGKFSEASGITATASTAINNSISAIAEIPSTWLSIIVTVAAAAIILTLVVRSFALRR